MHEKVHNIIDMTYMTDREERLDVSMRRKEVSYREENIIKIHLEDQVLDYLSRFQVSASLSLSHTHTHKHTLSPSLPLMPGVLLSIMSG